MSDHRTPAWALEGRRQGAYMEMQCAEEIAYRLLVTPEEAQGAPDLTDTAVEMYEDALVRLAQLDAQEGGDEA